jgi:hypothetical protein
VLCVARRLIPGPGPALGPIQRMDHRAAIPLASRRRGGVPDVAVGRAEGEVAHPNRTKPPGELPIRTSWRSNTRASFVLSHDLHHPVRASGTPQSLAHGRAEHFVRIDQFAGGAQQPSLRHGDRHLVVGVAHVELGVPQIGVGLPAVEVVVHRDVRIPVGQEEGFAVVSPPRRTVWGHGELPGESELRPAAGG